MSFILYFWPWPCNAEAAKFPSTSPPPPHVSLIPLLAPSLFISLSLSCYCRAWLFTSTHRPALTTRFCFLILISMQSAPRFHLSPLFLHLRMPLFICTSTFLSEFNPLLPLSSVHLSAPTSVPPTVQIPPQMSTKHPTEIKLRGHCWGRSVFDVCERMWVFECTCRCLGGCSCSYFSAWFIVCAFLDHFARTSVSFYTHSLCWGVNYVL